MLSRVFRKLTGSGAHVTATVGGTVAEGAVENVQRQALASLRERYAPDATAVNPDLPESAYDHIANLLDENVPRASTYVSEYEAAGIDATEYTAVYDVVIECVVSAALENIQQHAEEAEEAADRIVQATQTQSSAINELSSTVEKLTSDQNVEDVE